jgi:hypothetical protein
MPTLARIRIAIACCIAFVGCLVGCAAGETERQDTSRKSKIAEPKRAAAQPLFPDKGAPKGWSVRAWDDVSKPGPEGAKWMVDEDGVLHGSEPRGTWLVSDRDYGDFILEYDFKLGERGNSGCGVRFPPRGDPAFDGLEIQMNDERYNNGQDAPNQLTGSFYKAIAPKKQVYKPMEWNHYVMSFKGPQVKIELNGEVIQDVNLDEHNTPVKRHDNTDAPPLKDRPRRGRIGFQELSRGGAHALIRNAKITILGE